MISVVAYLSYILLNIHSNITDVGDYVSNTPFRDDGSLSVNLGMLEKGSIG